MNDFHRVVLGIIMILVCIWLLVGGVFMIAWFAPELGRHKAQVGVQSKRYGAQRAAIAFCQKQAQVGTVTQHCSDLVSAH